MKFDDCAINYYPTLTEALKDYYRKSIYDEYTDQLESIETQLFDNYFVDGIYLINEFFDKNIFSISKLPILFEMTRKAFDKFADDRKIDEMGNFSVYVKTDGEVFHYNNGLWESSIDKINKKEIWKK